ncbi:MAG: DUF4956 domain-containing protein [Sphingobacteriia bacterium]|nr:DUF4956 domain-containing protein [Sphingobacteriia bacterium]
MYFYWRHRYCITCFSCSVRASKTFKKEAVTLIQYDNLELLQPFNKAALQQDLKQRTGLNISRISIVKIDFTKASAQLRVYCKED